MVAAGDIRGATSRIEPIAAGEWRRAVPLLGRGFPERRPAFWEAGIARHRRLGGSAAGGAPLGQVLVVDGADVGVLLTLASARALPDGATGRVVNLCGWYVDEGHRWRAPMMLRQATRDAGTVFTDLTPSPAVDRINAALGFARWTEGTMLDVLPWSALGPVGTAEVVPFPQGAGDLAPETRALLEAHRAEGCLAAILCRPEGASPLLFRRSRSMGVPVAQLVLAESRRAVIAHRAAVARFLLARGVAALTVDADRAECPPGTAFRPGRARWLKGPMERDRVDYAASELVALDLAS